MIKVNVGLDAEEANKHYTQKQNFTIVSYFIVSSTV